MRINTSERKESEGMLLNEVNRVKQQNENRKKEKIPVIKKGPHNGNNETTNNLVKQINKVRMAATSISRAKKTTTTAA